MNIPVKEFKQRRRIALEADFQEISARLVGLLDWMESVRPIAKIIMALEVATNGYGEEPRRNG